MLTPKNQTQIQFTAPRGEWDLISQIAIRALAMLPGHDFGRTSKMDIMMDIEAVHCNGSPLKLASLLAADDFNFAHDVFGIRRHLNRETGELMNCFVPRFAKPERAPC